MISCLPVPYLNTKYPTYLFMWLVFFFGSTIIAPLTGIMLNSVEPQRRTTANSIATLAYNLFGYLPAPFLYGVVSDLFDDKVFSNRAAMGVILYWSCFSFIFILGAMTIQFRKDMAFHNISFSALLSFSPAQIKKMAEEEIESR